MPRTVVPVFDEGGAGVEDFGEEGLGDEAGAPGGDGIGGFELAAEVGLGDAEDEVFDGVVVPRGDIAERERGVAEVGKEGGGGGGRGHGRTGDGRECECGTGRRYCFCLGSQEKLFGFVRYVVSCCGIGVCSGDGESDSGLRVCRDGARSCFRPMRRWGSD